MVWKLFRGSEQKMIAFGESHYQTKSDETGEFIVNQHLQTSVDHIYAVDDVTGGPQFTCISLDDYRIVKNQSKGDGSRTAQTYALVPYTLFVNPTV